MTTDMAGADAARKFRPVAKTPRKRTSGALYIGQRGGYRLGAVVSNFSAQTSSGMWKSTGRRL
jgi:hypothetical protein